ncbi:hypothetical protein [Maridesulfovibrio hydrothermalis]|uniref:Lipoprotein n=1 Tax=Maridesulfovibrio hydrothermalis AM13 = DSM 14728 TaxID=1121451 RepID=L0R9K4_9BACT|nr:hypothetical protein [Maridesulfovibrio hydrothermalis]CCO23438.1 conserved exported protein of unknown function [Maridesulfovibrio hydrothermalis AM13 = DSM 14728]
MLTRLAAALIIATLMISALGCAKMGKATGQAVKEIKEMPGEFHDGYKDGRTTKEDAI